MKKADYILTSDWHIRETKPVCRVDEFLMDTMWKKINFISELQKEHCCPILHSGDLFDHWKPSPELLSMAMYNLPANFYTIYGNHDLPQHNLDLAHKSGVYALEAGKAIEIPFGGLHWGLEPDKGEPTMWAGNGAHERKILLWHIFTYDGDLPFPGCNSLSALQLLKKYPEYDLILTGDNHKTFVKEYKGRLLVNPGSIFRMDADQIDHKPCVFLYYAKTNTVKPVYIPIKKNAVSREHLETAQQRNDRIDAFVGMLNTEFGVEISFEKNLEKFFASNNIKKEVKRIIINSLTDE